MYSVELMQINTIHSGGNILRIYQHNQYDILKSYLMCYPVNFKITDKTNKYYNNINYELLYSQYNNFIDILTNEDVKIKFIDINKSESQVFTKDIGFVIEDIFFITKMKKYQRAMETQILKKLIKENSIRYYEMKSNIEGGDIIYHGDAVFVGMSSRTSIESVYELENVFKMLDLNIDVVPIHFDTHMLHLDCVFNTLDKDSAILSPYVYDVEIIKKYINNLYCISKEDSDKLGTNIVYLGNRRVISSNENVVDMLNSNVYKARYVDYSEIMKAGGSLACSTLSLLRE